MPDDPVPVTLTRSEGIFSVADVPATVRFYRDKLGFVGEWLWGDPPTFGGVTWGKVGVMFCLDPELAAKVEGHYHAFAVTGIDELYARHRANGVDIVSPLELKPWGMREYTVRDLNGYHLRIGEPTVSHATGTPAKPLPSSVRLEERLPTAEEYEELIRSVGWGRYSSPAIIAAALTNTLFAVVAVESGRSVGMARVIGDGGSDYYLQDVVVRPDCQKQGIGTAIVDAVVRLFRERTPARSSMGLFTGRNLAGFYERHGFEGPDRGLYGMFLKKHDAPT